MSNEFDRLFDDPGEGLTGHPLCECPDAGALLMAEINGEPRPLCRKHDAAEINARNVEAERNHAQGNLDRLRAAHDDATEWLARANAAAAQAEIDATEREALAALALTDPLVADLHRLTGTPVVEVPIDPQLETPIGDDKAFVRMLTEIVGGALNPDDPEGPTAA